MKLAYNEAIDAWMEEEVPVGAVIEYDGRVIGSEHNRIESSGDPTAHAEILAITQASRYLRDWRLTGASLYVTKEPCPMCSGAVIMARMSRVIYALPDPDLGCLGGATDINRLPALRNHITVTSGILEEECRDLIQTFFSLRRRSESDYDYDHD